MITAKWSESSSGGGGGGGGSSSSSSSSSQVGNSSRGLEEDQETLGGREKEGCVEKENTKTVQLHSRQKPNPTVFSWSDVVTCQKRPAGRRGLGGLLQNHNLRGQNRNWDRQKVPKLQLFLLFPLHRGSGGFRQKVCVCVCAVCRTEKWLKTFVRGRLNRKQR